MAKKVSYFIKQLSLCGTIISIKILRSKEESPLTLLERARGGESGVVECEYVVVSLSSLQHLPLQGCVLLSMQRGC